MIIVDSITGEILAKHSISLEKGKLIKNRNHERDRSKSIEILKQHVISLFPNEDESKQFIDEICHTYGRYRRDQLLILQKIAEEDSQWIPLALKKCLNEKLYSANAFRDVVDYLKQQPLNPIPEIIRPSTKTVSIPVETRDFSTYIMRMGGPINE